MSDLKFTAYPGPIWRGEFNQLNTITNCTLRTDLKTMTLGACGQASTDYKPANSTPPTSNATLPDELNNFYARFSDVKKWRDIRPSMVTHTRNLCSAINPSKVHTHSSEHTYTVNTHPEQWAVVYAAAPGEQLGVWCLAQGHLSRGIEGGESAVHSLPPPTIPAGPRLKLATFGLRVWLSNH